MSADLRLVVFDVDGTLVDSQGDIIGAMTSAFVGNNLPVPDRAAILGVVGLSLDVLMPMLAPDVSTTTHARLVQAYKDSYMDARKQQGTTVSSPLYDGARACLEALNAQPNILLGVATGKSKRGLDKLIEGHGFEGLFVTQQVADFHPSKPHPSMLLQAMTDAGVAADNALMIGDTSFDMDMATSAGMRGIGVTWGYHTPDRLVQATRLADNFADLPTILNEVWSTPA
jgi:phosphoglycolate phosphatase